MKHPGKKFLVTVLGFVLQAGTILGQAPMPAVRQTSFSPGTQPLLSPLAENDVPAEIAKMVRPLLQRPTLRSTGPVETFRCSPMTYYWLLENPDQTAKLWREIGATCADIRRRAPGVFAWRGENGSEVVWQIIHRGPNRHVWYAEGEVQPGALLPAVSVKAIVCAGHVELRDADGSPVVRHQMELIIKTSNHVAALATKILGASAPRMAEDYVGQIEMFFAAMAWYLDQNPDKAARLFEKIRQESR